MRNIKFRVWNRFHKRMDYGGDFYDTRSAYEPEKYIFGILIYGEPNEAEVMQFTGLKDKNGKEIHEGDVIIYCQHPDYDGRTHFHLRGAHEVKWLQNGMNRTGWNIGNGDHQIVIGNIYENPELLTGHRPL